PVTGISETSKAVLLPISSEMTEVTQGPSFKGSREVTQGLWAGLSQLTYTTVHWTRSNTHTHTHTHTHTNMHTHTQQRTCTRTRTRTHTHKYADKRRQTYVHTQNHTNYTTHTHTHM